MQHVWMNSGFAAHTIRTLITVAVPVAICQTECLPIAVPDSETYCQGVKERLRQPEVLDMSLAQQGSTSSSDLSAGLALGRS